MPCTNLMCSTSKWHALEEVMHFLGLTLSIWAVLPLQLLSQMLELLTLTSPFMWETPQQMYTQWLIQLLLSLGVQSYQTSLLTLMQVEQHGLELLSSQLPVVSRRLSSAWFRQLTPKLWPLRWRRRLRTIFSRWVLKQLWQSLAVVFIQSTRTPHLPTLSLWLMEIQMLVSFFQLGHLLNKQDVLSIHGRFQPQIMARIMPLQLLAIYKLQQW